MTVVRISLWLRSAAHNGSFLLPLRIALVLIAVVGASSFAQDAGLQALTVPPKAVNPGQADSPGDVLRDAGLEDSTPATVADTHPYIGDGDAGIETTIVPPPVDQVATASAEAAFTEDAWSLSAKLGASIRASYQGATRFFIDPDTRTTVAPFLTRVRATPEIHLKGFGLIAEADAATGALVGAPGESLVGTRVPYPAVSAVELRKVYLEYKWNSGAFRVGQQTSQWGLGLLANDGSHEPEAGDFGQQQFGTLAYRALFAVRPLYELGGRYRAFETAVAADLVARDATAEFNKGDRAFQGVLAMRFVRDDDNQLGVYVVYRNQKNVNVTDGGKATDVVVFDASGKWEFLKKPNRNRVLRVGFEAVGITGSTTQARNENAAVLSVRQFGAAVKGAYRTHNTTLMLDWGYASGDQNPADARADAFRFDRDYKVGLVLFDQVLAYQTARASVRAADPNLTGVPAEGADLIGTGGAVSGAWYLFPRAKVGLQSWLDIYGGPLFAFTTAKLTDPFMTRITGGTPANSLGGKPGNFLGTEIDLGLQARFEPIRELRLVVTAEGGLFLPGDAFNQPDNTAMSPVGFGRLRASLAL